MDVKIWPYKQGDKGVLCMPLCRNIPKPKQNDWIKTICPVCGSDCWETDIHRSLKKTEQHNLKAMCTECAVRANI